MKSFIRIMLVTGLTVGVFNFAGAQRARNNAGSQSRGNRESNVSQQRGNTRSFSEARPNRDNNGSRYNSVPSGGNQRIERGQIPDRGNNNRINQQRSEVTRNDVRGGRNFGGAQQSNERGNAVSSERYDRDRGYSRNDNYAYNNYRYGNSYYRNGYNSYSRNGFNGRFVFMTGPRYRVIPRNSVSIYFGGYPYYYNEGFYYSYYGGYYEPIFPPIGLRIGFLPYGYSRLFIGGYPYYYYNGIYYRQYENNDYEVVDPPMGATVYSLPQGAKSVILNGEKLYELNGTYYKEDRNSKGEVIYTVVGKNGEINNTDENTNQNNLPLPPPSNLQVGDMVNQLPEGSKIVTINGEKMYVTPDDTYLKEESNGSIVQYRVVGK